MRKLRTDLKIPYGVSVFKTILASCALCSATALAEMPKTATLIPAPREMRVTGGRTVCGMGAEEPTGYVPVMLSNGSLCMTADFLGGVPSDETRKLAYDITRGIFIVGRRFGGPGFRSPHGIQVEAFNFGSFALKVSVDGKRCGAPDRWSQTFDPLVARSITTNVFGNVTRVAETFVAPNEDTIVVRQTFPGTDLSRIDAGLNYVIRNTERFHGKWSNLPDGCAFDYTSLGLDTYKGRITVRHAWEDGAFVTFISFGKPYQGTYAAASARHAADWGNYYAASEVDVPDADIMRMRRVAEYQLKCCTTKWSIPPGIPPSHWSAGIFAFDEMYAVQGLLSAGHFDEARRASDYRFRTLKTATARTNNTGARWVWISMETNPDDCAKNGFWLEHIFHMSAVARSCRLVASYTGDEEYLRAKAYPVIRECARFFRNHCIYDMPDGSSFVCKCTDLERLRSGRERPFMTTCGAIDTLRTAASAAERLGVDAKDASDWRATAERLLKSLPEKDGRFVPAADRPDAVSMGSLAGYFPFPIFRLYTFAQCGVPVLFGPGKALGTLSDGEIAFDRCRTSSSEVQKLRDALDARAGGTPAVLESPFVGLVMPRVAADGSLRNVALLGLRLDDQGTVRLRLRGVPENATHAVWREIRCEPVTLSIHREGGICRVEVPSIGVWNGGFLEFQRRQWK